MEEKFLQCRSTWCLEEQAYSVKEHDFQKNKSFQLEKIEDAEKGILMEKKIEKSVSNRVSAWKQRYRSYLLSIRKQKEKD